MVWLSPVQLCWELKSTSLATAQNQRFMRKISAPFSVLAYGEHYFKNNELSYYVPYSLPVYVRTIPVYGSLVRLNTVHIYMFTQEPVGRPYN